MNRTDPLARLLRAGGLVSPWGRPCGGSLSAVLVLGLLAAAPIIRAQSIAAQPLSYQGHLTVDGVAPAPGARFELLFRLFDAAAGGNPVSGVLGPRDIEPMDGLFTAELDFGPTVFNGQPRWLEVAARPGGTSGAFTTLSPRQRITWTPYASFADAASRVTGLVSAAQLPASAARLDLNQTFTGAPTFAAPGGAPFYLTSTQRVERLNADLLDGVDASGFWRRAEKDGVASIIEPSDLPVEIQLANGLRGTLRLDRGVISPNFIYSLVPNSVATGLSGVVYLGGGEKARPNRIKARFATIVGGRANVIETGAQFSGLLAADGGFIGANARNSVIVGGSFLRIEGDSLFSSLLGGSGNVLRTNVGSAAIVGGYSNEIGTGSHFAGLLGGDGNTIEGGAQRAAILGGQNNIIEFRAEDSAVLGGYRNRVGSNATHAVVVGGDRNYATKQFTLAAGRQARAEHFGSFVWSDSEAGGGPFASQKNNEFAVKATGGVRFETKGAGLWVDGQRFLPPGGPGTIPDGSILAAKLADGAVLLELADDDGAGSGLDADRLDGLSSEDFWRLTGNAGTTPGVNFLGTTDAQPLELKVNNVRGFRMQPDLPKLTSTEPPMPWFPYSPSLIGGYAGNSIPAAVAGSVISGGGSHGSPANPFVEMPNVITADFASINGGLNNETDGWGSAIGGGEGNRIEYGSSRAVVAGGGYNRILDSAQYATISGGSNNRIDPSASYAVIGGGRENLVQTNAAYATVGGGFSNQARADYAAIGGGLVNVVHALASFGTIGGGELNLIFSGADYSTIAGGRRNELGNDGDCSFIGGGQTNRTESYVTCGVIAGGAGNTIQPAADCATVGGGQGNTILSRSHWATIPGGRDNSAAGRYSFAAGHRAKANHEGSFVWADSHSEDFASTAADQFSIRASGGVRIIGALTTFVLTITGGADLAEPFQMSGRDIPKGAVVVIDEHHAGQLRLSDRAYDKRVAGIVSGANGVNPGITLSQQGLLEGEQHVALSGRVYALADAAPGAIVPGDLLTTSDIPGHAMKAADAAKAQGAILGKAMGALPHGRGLVLVLVSLQ